MGTNFDKIEDIIPTVRGFSDENSHYIQNKVDLILDMVKNNFDKKDIILSLIEVRDMIPCTCGEEYD